MEGSGNRSRSIQIITDPDPGGPKTGSGTLLTITAVSADIKLSINVAGWDCLSACALV
jgi:hypothetical protein